MLNARAYLNLRTDGEDGFDGSRKDWSNYGQRLQDGVYDPENRVVVGMLGHDVVWR